MKIDWSHIEQFAIETAASVSSVLLTAFINKEIGAPGAVAITAGNMGKLAGIISATSVLQHLQAVAAAPEQFTVQPISVVATAPISVA